MAEQAIKGGSHSHRLRTITAAGVIAAMIFWNSSLLLAGPARDTRAPKGKDPSGLVVSQAGEKKETKSITFDLYPSPKDSFYNGMLVDVSIGDSIVPAGLSRSSINTIPVPIAIAAGIPMTYNDDGTLHGSISCNIQGIPMDVPVLIVAQPFVRTSTGIKHIEQDNSLFMPDQNIITTSSITNLGPLKFSASDSGYVGYDGDSKVVVVPRRVTVTPNRLRIGPGPFIDVLKQLGAVTIPDSTGEKISGGYIQFVRSDTTNRVTLSGENFVAPPGAVGIPFKLIRPHPGENVVVIDGTLSVGPFQQRGFFALDPGGQFVLALSKEIATRLTSQNITDMELIPRSACSLVFLNNSLTLTISPELPVERPRGDTLLVQWLPYGINGSVGIPSGTAVVDFKGDAVYFGVPNGASQYGGPK
ncbi:MAG: hypothetical protein V1909_03275 [Candidatus Micrarchaeota archaeon]